ncbi:MAG: PRC-barrel domain-containing protein [Rhodospirillales bacterium]|nr:PRC-barrel domain-containing protein [Rhodospirillales bacterium]
MSTLKCTTAFALVMSAGAVLASTAPAAASPQGNNCSLSAAGGTNTDARFQTLDADGNGEISKEAFRNCMQTSVGSETPQQDMQRAGETLVAADQNSGGKAAADEIKQQPATSEAPRAQAKVGESEETHTQGATGMEDGATAGPAAAAASTEGTQTPASDSPATDATSGERATRASAGTPSAEPSDSVRTGGQQANGQQKAEVSFGAGAESFKAEDIVGRDVVNRNGEDVGEISAVVVDSLKQDVYAVVSIGGFLGIGDQEVVIPLTELDIGEDAVTLMSQQTRDELKSLPAYDEESYEPIDSGAEPAGSNAR